MSLGMQLLMSLIVSVITSLEFSITFTSTSSSICNGSSSKFFHVFNQSVENTSGSYNLSLPKSSHVTCCQRIVDPGNPICPVHLQVLGYSTAIYFLEGLPKFFTYPKEITLVVIPHLPNVVCFPIKLHRVGRKGICI